MGGITSQEERLISITSKHIMPAYYSEKELTPADCLLVRNSWSIMLKDDFISFYDTFYERLFDVHPTLRPLFKTNMTTQAKALVKMIYAALEVLNDSSVLSDALNDLANRHSGYGAIAVKCCYGHLKKS
jgi:hemoglobin-like flavoprotein